MRTIPEACLYPYSSSRPALDRRALLSLLLAAGSGLATAPARAEHVNIRFHLDWRFEAPTAFFLVPAARGYFKAEHLNVSFDAGSGSGMAVSRVASGIYDMGFADLAALMDFHANNPTAPSKPVAVMMVYNHTPSSVFALRKSGIRRPADLGGRTMGAPIFDAGRRSFPAFQKANRVAAVHWITMDPPLRETMLIRGDVDAVTGYYFTTLPNLEARGVKREDITVMPFPQLGVRLYGNAIIASEEFIMQNPAAVKGFLRAFTKGARDVIADPRAAIAVLKARENAIDTSLEERRLRLAITSSIDTPDARAEGFGDVNMPRLALMSSQVADAFQTRSRVDPRAIWDGRFLPPAAERNILAPRQ